MNHDCHVVKKVKDIPIDINVLIVNITLLLSLFVLFMVATW